MTSSVYDLPLDLAPDVNRVAPSFHTAFPHEPAERLIPEEIIEHQPADLQASLPNRMDRGNLAYTLHLETAAARGTAIDDE